MEGLSMLRRIILKEAFVSHLKHSLPMAMQYTFKRVL